MLYLNTKFPRTKKKYAKEADDNTDLLIDRMSKLLKSERTPSTAMAAIAAIKPKTGGSTHSYSYAERKRAKTFKLL